MARTHRRYGSPDDRQLDAFIGVASLAFAATEGAVKEWLAPWRDQVRVLTAGAEVVAGLVLIPMGQYFGGRCVPMCGVAGVATAPQHRGAGTATALMTEAVREMRQRGEPLSTLYASTMTLYRGVGYGAAGGHYKLHISLKNLSLRERGLMVRPIESSAEGGGEGRAAVERLYRAHARTRAGWLERGPYVWHRVWRERDNIPVRGFSFVGDAGPEGYVLYTQQSRDDGDYDLAVRDLVSATPAAARRALGFLADHRSMAAEASWYGGPDDPHMYLLPERGYRMNLREHWMLRLTDVAEALAQRGYAPAVSARLDLEVTDSAIADNSGRFSLAVQDGVAEVRRGGRGSLALSVNALAGLYSGHLSAHQLAVAGAASGSARALATASAIFAGPPPTLPDFF